MSDKHITSQKTISKYSINNSIQKYVLIIFEWKFNYSKLMQTWHLLKTKQLIKKNKNIEIF